MAQHIVDMRKYEASAHFGPEFRANSIIIDKALEKPTSIAAKSYHKQRKVRTGTDERTKTVILQHCSQSASALIMT